MPPSKRSFRDTIEALKAIIDESLKHPEKRQEFVDEGSIELIIGELLRTDKIRLLLLANLCSVLKYGTSTSCLYGAHGME